MVKPASFDEGHADALGGGPAVIADEIAAEAIEVHGADLDTAHQATGIALLDQGSVRHWPMLALSSGVSNTGRLAATNVEAAIAEIAGALGMSDAPVRHWPMLALSSGAGPGVVPHLSKPAAHAAGNISIVDAGGYFTGGDVEQALQQVGASARALPGVVGGYAPLSSGLLVPVGYLGTGTPDSTKFLRGDGTWAVPPGASGGITKTTYGTTSLGGSFDTSSRVVYKQITLLAAGLIASISVGFKGNGSNVGGLGVALFADNAGVPGAILAVGANDPYNGTLSIYKSSTAAFVTRPLSHWVAAGTYWITVGATYNAGGAQLAYAASGSDWSLVPAGNIWFTDASLTAPTNSTRNYSIYCDVLT